MVLRSSSGSWWERVGQKARVELLQMSGSSSMRGAGEVRATWEVVHPKVASPLIVFPQYLGTLLLINEPSSRGAELRRAVKRMGHYTELLADSGGGDRRGRSRRVVRGGCCCCCLKNSLMLEQPSQMWIGSQGEVRVRLKCQSLPTMVMLLNCQLPPRIPGEAVWTL